MDFAELDAEPVEFEESDAEPEVVPDEEEEQTYRAMKIAAGERYHK